MIFKPDNIGRITLKNRIIRSATFEGMADKEGVPTKAYLDLYNQLAENEVGAIITGFTFISQCGRAMQPGQAGIDADDKISLYKQMTDKVHEHDGKIFMQIAHCGRQTTELSVGGVVHGASAQKSRYFRSNPEPLSTNGADDLVQKFADAALRCKHAGFDGVQLHAAHGYLIHQFILPSINNRKDIYGIDPKTGIGTGFLKSIIKNIREVCGSDFAILVKISAGDNYSETFNEKNFIQLIKFLDNMKVSAIEISYGTMDHALNIFRGKTVPLNTILKYNPRYKTANPLIQWISRKVVYPWMKARIKPFSPMYNLPYAEMAKKHTCIPIICVGGFRSYTEIQDAIEKHKTDFVSLCRPFICEPNFAKKIKGNPDYKSRCLNCNLCAIMCDSPFPTKCYWGKDI